MVIYFIFILIPIWAHLVFPERRNDKVLKRIISVLLCTFYCMSYMNGSDWRQYEPMYNEINLQRPFYDYKIEFGYQLVSVIFRMIGVDFWHFFIFIKILCFYSFCSFFERYAQSYYYLCLFFFLCFFGPFLFIDAPFRNLIAVSIFLKALPHLFSKNLLKYILIVFIAFSFHYSSFFLFFLYFLMHGHYKSRTIVIVYIALNIFFIFFVDVFKQFVVDFVSLIPFFTKKVGSYFIAESDYSQGSEFTIGNLLRIVFFILVIKYRKNIEAHFGEGFFNALIIYFILYRLAVSIVIFGRLTLYFTAIYSCGIAFLVTAFPKKLRLMYSLGIMLVSLMTFYVQLKSDYKYVPYTSYMEYIFERKPDYNYRSNYNFIRSPYRKERD